MREDTFRLWWHALAEEGYCDDLPGAQFRRVLQRWLAAGKPRDVFRFILRWANVSAEGDNAEAP